MDLEIGEQVFLTINAANRPFGDVGQGSYWGNYNWVDIKAQIFITNCGRICIAKKMYNYHINSFGTMTGPGLYDEPFPQSIKEMHNLNMHISEDCQIMLQKMFDGMCKIVDRVGWKSVPPDPDPLWCNIGSWHLLLATDLIQHNNNYFNWIFDLIRDLHNKHSQATLDQQYALLHSACDDIELLSKQNDELKRQNAILLDHYEKIVRPTNLKLHQQNIRLVEHNNYLSQCCYKLCDELEQPTQCEIISKDIQKQITTSVETNVALSREILDDIMKCAETYMQL
jgi:hypothetical protein